MIIKNKTKFTDESVKAIMRASNFDNSRYKLFKMIYNVFGLVFGMMFVRCMVMQLTGQEGYNKSITMLYAAATLCFLYLGMYGMDRSNIKRYQGIYKGMAGTEYSYEIDSSEITVKARMNDSEDTSVINWDSIVKWKEDTDSFFLFLDEKECLIVDKKGFEEGTAKDLKELAAAVMESRKAKERNGD